MKLVSEAKQWHRLWSVRLAVLSAALSACEALMPIWQPHTPPGVFAALATLVGIAAAVARTVKQESLRGDE
jgi:hypothetical protein